MEIPGPEQIGIQETISALVDWLRLCVETIAAAFVAIGVVRAVMVTIRRPHTSHFNSARLTLARYLVVALEFQLAADILMTTIAPTWDKIGKLAAIALIRTVLNHFLMEELKFEREQ